MGRGVEDNNMAFEIINFNLKLKLNRRFFYLCNGTALGAKDHYLGQVYGYIVPLLHERRYDWILVGY
jgi:hypothetical protein